MTLQADRQLVVLVGHPKPLSRTHATAIRAGGLLHLALTEHVAPFARPTVVDLAELAPHVLDRHRRGGALETAVTAVQQATLLLAATPTFRATYSGLLKLFLDVLPRDALAGTVALPLMTAGLPAHRRAVDETLRPILLELGAAAPTIGISVLESELGQVDEVFRDWWDEHGNRLANAILARTDGVGRRLDDVEWGGAVATRVRGAVPE